MAKADLAALSSLPDGPSWVWPFAQNRFLLRPGRLALRASGLFSDLLPRPGLPSVGMSLGGLQEPEGWARWQAKGRHGTGLQTPSIPLMAQFGF